MKKILVTAVLLGLTFIHVAGQKVQVEVQGKKYVIDENPYDIGEVEGAAQAKAFLQGNTIMMKFIFTRKISLEVASANVSEGVYRTVQKYPAGQSAEIWLFMSPEGFKDKDGKQPQSMMSMGIIKLPDLAAIRKVPNVNAYIRNPTTFKFYVEQIRPMPYAEYLGR